MSQPYANLLGALKEGYFFKCGDKHKSWKQRWFVLTKDILYYFEKETSTEPLGIIPLKDYQRCKGMEGDAFQATGKENSFYLQTPYRQYKAYCKDWRTSEEWAESIAALGEFLKKKEEIRKPTQYQQEVLRLTNDAINYSSSLIHWFKLVVDSTPTYKNGIRSIYFSAIYDIPSQLGTQTIALSKAALAAMTSANSPPKLESLKIVAQKVMTQLEKAEGFVVCCNDTHKGKFAADLEVIKRAVKGLIDMRPMFPSNLVTDASVALCKLAFYLCQNYVVDEDPVVPPTRAAKALALAEPEPDYSTVPPASLLEEFKALQRVVTANTETLKGKPVFNSEQPFIQQIQVSLTKVENATTELVTQLQDSRGIINTSRVVALYHDLPANCREIISLTEKLFPENR